MPPLSKAYGGFKGAFQRACGGVGSIFLPAHIRDEAHSMFLWKKNQKIGNLGTNCARYGKILAKIREVIKLCFTSIL